MFPEKKKIYFDNTKNFKKPISNIPESFELDEGEKFHLRSSSVNSIKGILMKTPFASTLKK
jgi:hypothetical protein